MISSRPRISRFAAASLLLAAACSLAQAAGKPAAVQALESRGLTVMQEFKVGGGLRAFAAVAGDRPIAIYVTSDGNAILGTRLDAKGEPLDEAKLETLAAKPLGDRQWAQLESSTWVQDGKANAPRVIYTFTDANCPYCHRFSEAARPWVAAGKVQLRHIMVGIIKDDSPAKAAAILSAKDRTAALLENQKKHGQGGIAAAKNISEDMRRRLDANQTLMLSMGFRGTPGIVVRAPDGMLKKYNGMPQQAALAEVLGPR